MIKRLKIKIDDYDNSFDIYYYAESSMIQILDTNTISQIYEVEGDESELDGFFRELAHNDVQYKIITLKDDKTIQLEELMEKYNIKDIEQLEKLLNELKGNNNE